MKVRINITIDKDLYDYAVNNNIKISTLINKNLKYLIDRFLSSCEHKIISEEEAKELIKIASAKWTSRD